MRCSYRKPNRKRCGASALSGGNLCYFHSMPGRAAEAGSKGGKRRAIFRAADLKHFAPAKSAAELGDVVGQTLCDVRDGRLDAKTANAIGCLATCLLSVLKANTLEARMTAIEKFITEKKHELRKPN